MAEIPDGYLAFDRIYGTTLYFHWDEAQPDGSTVNVSMDSSETYVSGETMTVPAYFYVSRGLVLATGNCALLSSKR